MYCIWVPLHHVAPVCYSYFGARLFILIVWFIRNLFLAVTSRFRLAAVDALVRTVIRVFTEEKICSMDTVSYIQLVRSCHSSNEMKISKMYLNVYLRLVCPSCRRLASFWCFLSVAMCAVILSSLMAVTDNCLRTCIDPVHDMAVAKVPSVDIGGILRYAY